jgi:hypothetical protein
MKRKPILFKRIAEEHCGEGREVIGLIGTRHGAGVTFTGLMLAFYMGEERSKKTAFLECNEHHDMRLIQNAYEWSREEGNSFSFHKITCYKEVPLAQVPELFGENYECIILDFGIDFAANREELLRCNTKIVIGGRSQWDIQKLKLFIDSVKNIRGSENWLYFIPQTDHKIITEIKKEVMCSIWPVPVVSEPTAPSNDTNRFLGRFFDAL